MYNALVEMFCPGYPGKINTCDKITVSFNAHTITVLNLITRTVSEQVRLLNAQSSIDFHTKRLCMERQYLSEQDVKELAKKGRIVFENESTQLVLNVDACIRTALEGFRRRRFIISVNGTRPERLSDHVVLLPNTEVLFARIVPLAGG